MPLRGMINKIRPRIMASVRTLKETTLSLQIPDLTTTDAVVAPHVVIPTRVTKNAADLILEAVVLLGAMGGHLAQAKVAPVELTTGMLTLRLSPRFTSLLLKGSLVKMTLEESLESSELLKQSRSETTTALSSSKNISLLSMLLKKWTEALLSTERRLRSNNHVCNQNL